MLASLCYLRFCDARYQIVLIVAPLTILLSFSARNQRVPARALAQPQNLSRHLSVRGGQAAGGSYDYYFFFIKSNQHPIH